MRPPATGPLIGVRWNRRSRRVAEVETRLFRQRPAAERFAERKVEDGYGQVVLFVAEVEAWRELRRWA